MSHEQAVSVRPCSAEDLVPVAALLSQLHPAEPPLNPSSSRVLRAWQAMLARPNERWLLIALQDGVLVGTIDCLIVPNLTHDGAAYGVVENFVVDALHRRAGVGTVLMGAVIERARQAGCYKLQLLSRADRTEAHAFYERAGFAYSAQGYRLYL